MMLKSILKRAGFGFLLGVAVCAVISALASDGSMVDPVFAERAGSLKGAVLLQLLLMGAYGALTMGLTVLYDLDHLPLTLSTGLHCVCCIAPFVFLAMLFRWTQGIRGILLIAGLQLLGFFLVWLILYVRYRKQINELNQMQAEALNNEKTEDGES